MVVTFWMCEASLQHITHFLLMPVWLDVILEIIKITVPALIVFATAYYMLNTLMKRQSESQMLELKQKQTETTLPIKLTAYERLSLFCERIAMHNLVLRQRQPSMNAKQLRLSMLLSIQQELEHNITQQVYVSHELWQIIKVARDHHVRIINEVYDDMGERASADEYSERLLDTMRALPGSSLDKAQLAIKKEASLYL